MSAAVDVEAGIDAALRALRRHAPLPYPVGPAGGRGDAATLVADPQNRRMVREVLREAIAATLPSVLVVDDVSLDAADAVRGLAALLSPDDGRPRVEQITEILSGADEGAEFVISKGEFDGMVLGLSLAYAEDWSPTAVRETAIDELLVMVRDVDGDVEEG